MKIRSLSGMAQCSTPLILAAWLMVSPQAHANQPQPTLVIQVPQRFHEHPVRLLHPFINYWHNRATAAESVGLSSFADHAYATATCEDNPQGQALVVLEPNMFYNPKLGVFYSEITARFYTQSGVGSALDKPVLTLKSTGQTVGNLAHNVELFTRRAYQQAFDQLLTQLQANTAFTQTLAQSPSQAYQSLCHSIDTLTKPGIFY